ncbi:ABC transporter permease [Leifsonia poae]|uniref:ABC transporter permease n=1 Tax=Leifsonia poae TaxID=110933 RepID=UPI003D665010
MIAALWAEAVKLASSLAGKVATAAIVGGVIALSCVILAAVDSGNVDVISKLGPGASSDWTGFLRSSAQITAAGGLGGFGIILAWMFGREFTENTVSNLFGLPVGRATIALSKLVTYAIWSVLVSLVLSLGLLVSGLIAGLGDVTGEVTLGLLRQTALAVMTAVLALPIAWIATLARSVLGGVGATAGLIVIGQFSVLAGAGAWMPLAAPALWGLSGGSGATPLQLGMLIPYAAVSVALTALAWKRLELDR